MAFHNAPLSVSCSALAIKLQRRANENQKQTCAGVKVKAHTRWAQPIMRRRRGLGLRGIELS